nr:MAG TPA: hypothetical protein [Inoviridae sp.]
MKKKILRSMWYLLRDMTDFIILLVYLVGMSMMMFPVETMEKLNNPQLIQSLPVTGRVFLILVLCRLVMEILWYLPRLITRIALWRLRKNLPH